MGALTIEDNLEKVYDFFLHLSEIFIQNPVFYNNHYPAQKQIPETTGQFSWITMNADDSELINEKLPRQRPHLTLLLTQKNSIQEVFYKNTLLVSAVEKFGKV